MISERVRQILVCPDCRASVPDLACAACRESFDDTGQADLRPRQRHDVELQITLSSQPVSLPPIAPLAVGSGAVDFSSLSKPKHFTAALLSRIPPGDDELILDLGCGDGSHRAIADLADYEYVGVDYAGNGADLLADAHRLPFEDESFSTIVSMAVFEHLQWPLLAASEVKRVLKPGGVFIGTVAFSEPFHSNSYYHHTHLGIANNLNSAGLEILELGPSPDWTALRAHAKNSMFPGMPVRARMALVAPVGLIHRWWWRVGRRFKPAFTETRRMTLSTGSWHFVAKRPEAVEDNNGRSRG